MERRRRRRGRFGFFCSLLCRCLAPSLAAAARRATNTLHCTGNTRRARSEVKEPAANRPRRSKTKKAAAFCSPLPPRRRRRDSSAHAQERRLHTRPSICGRAHSPAGQPAVRARLPTSSALPTLTRRSRARPKPPPQQGLLGSCQRSPPPPCAAVAPPAAAACLLTAERRAPPPLAGRPQALSSMSAAPSCAHHRLIPGQSRGPAMPPRAERRVIGAANCRRC